MLLLAKQATKGCQVKTPTDTGLGKKTFRAQGTHQPSSKPRHSQGECHCSWSHRCCHLSVLRLKATQAIPPDGPKDTQGAQSSSSTLHMVIPTATSLPDPPCPPDPDGPPMTARIARVLTSSRNASSQRTPVASYNNQEICWTSLIFFLVFETSSIQLHQSPFGPYNVANFSIYFYETLGLPRCG